MKAKSLLGEGCLLIIGLLFGLSGVIAKYLSRYINPYQVVELRFVVAFLAVGLSVAVRRQPMGLTGVSKKSLVLFAITFPISVILFTESIFHTSVALAVFSFYSATLVIQFVIGKVIFKEAVGVYKRLALVTVLIALVVLSNPFGHFGFGWGLAFGVLSGVVQGVASSFQKKLSGSTSRMGLLFIQTFAGALGALLLVLSRGARVLPTLPVHAWLVVVVFGLILLGISYLFLVGYKYTNLNVGGILVSSELIFGPVLALVLLSERISSAVLLGGVLVILAAVLANLPEGQTRVS
jgi:drug/metabolite transporter (DMT)-like permease